MTRAADDWVDIGPFDSLPPRSGHTVPVRGGEEIAVFRTGDDRVFALINRCPHRHGPLSQGIVHGHAVACPLHNWRISLETGEALGEDEGCTPTVPVRVEDGRVLIGLASVIATAPAA